MGNSTQKPFAAFWFILLLCSVVNFNFIFFHGYSVFEWTHDTFDFLPKHSWFFEHFIHQFSLSFQFWYRQIWAAIGILLHIFFCCFCRFCLIFCNFTWITMRLVRFMFCCCCQHHKKHKISELFLLFLKPIIRRLIIDEWFWLFILFRCAAVFSCCLCIALLVRGKNIFCVQKKNTKWKEL